MIRNKDNRSLGNLIRRLMNLSTFITMLVFTLIVTVLLTLAIRPIAQLAAQGVAHSILREMTSPAFLEQQQIASLGELKAGTSNWHEWTEALNQEALTSYRIPVIDGISPPPKGAPGHLKRYFHTFDIIIEIKGKEIYRSRVMPPKHGIGPKALQRDGWLLSFYNRPYLEPVMDRDRNAIGTIAVRIDPKLLVSIVSMTTMMMILLGLLCIVANYLMSRWLVRPIIRPLSQLRDQFQKLADGKVSELYEHGLQLEKPYLEIQAIGAEAGRIINNTKICLDQLHEWNEELEAQKEELFHYATIDGLTGLLNRRHFMDIARTKLREEPADTSLILFDIDDFKRINDVYGHLAGDDVLVAFARILQQTFGDKGIAGRFGGEEFAVFVSGISREKCMTAAEHLRSRIAAEPMPIGGGKAIQVTVSIGVVYIGDKAISLEEMYQYGDQALYEAKHNGKNKVVLAGFSDSSL